MTKNDFFDYPGLVIAAAVWISGFIIFVRDTGEWFGSMSAAAILAALVWISYVIMRWMMKAVK
jgi:hypothetical protein